MEFIFQEDYQTMSVRMYLKRNEGDRIILIGQKDGVLIEQTLEPMNASVEPIIPLLEMNRHFAKKFLKAVGDYNSKIGIKNENENLLQGKLSATEKHLEDLRNHFTKVLDKVVGS
jgi:hypothetical protein